MFHTQGVPRMINGPEIIVEESFQQAWIAAGKLLRANGWDRRNLVVQIRCPADFDHVLHERVRQFARGTERLDPKDVAYTIFPHKLGRGRKHVGALCRAYNRQGGLFERVKRRARGTWGTYFRRMTHYVTPNGIVNQLEEIISAIRGDAKTHAGAFTMIIQEPGGETRKRRGGPCLNYVAIQMESGDPPVLGLLCVYRSHDFLERAYGNYWGLCNLLAFMARETRTQEGPVTCVSSRAFVDGHKQELSRFLDTL